MILHDLRCADCGSVATSVPCEFGAYGTCDCGGARKVTWENGQAPSNDLVKESVRFNRGLGMECATSRDIDREARVRGWEPVGDKLHGAERIPEYHPKPRPKPRHERGKGSVSGGAHFEEVA